MTQPNGAPAGGHAEVQVVQPAQRPETWQVVPVPGQQMIAIVIAHEHGQHISFVDIQFAMSLAANIERVATHARSGIVLPPGVGH